MYKITNLSRTVDIITDNETHRLGSRESVTVTELTSQMKNLESLKVIRVVELPSPKLKATTKTEATTSKPKATVAKSTKKETTSTSEKSN